MATSELKTPLIEVTNPATGQVVDKVPDLSASDVARLAERARAVQPTWDASGFKTRADVFRRAQKYLMDNATRFNDTIRAETGKTYEDAQPPTTPTGR